MTIDLVDDDVLVLRGLARFLRSQGWVVRTFPTAEDFLLRADDPPTACLILDVQMPGMSGLELLARLRSESNNLPVIFITAHEDPRVEQQTRSAGAAAFLRKPVYGRDLCAAINAALRRSL